MNHLLHNRILLLHVQRRQYSLRARVLTPTRNLHPRSGDRSTGRRLSACSLTLIELQLGRNEDWQHEWGSDKGGATAELHLHNSVYARAGFFDIAFVAESTNTAKLTAHLLGEEFTLLDADASLAMSFSKRALPKAVDRATDCTSLSYSNHACACQRTLNSVQGTHPTRPAELYFPYRQCSGGREQHCLLHRNGGRQSTGCHHFV